MQKDKAYWDQVLVRAQEHLEYTGFDSISDRLTQWGDGRLSIDTGDCLWRHPGIPGSGFTEKEQVISHIRNRAEWAKEKEMWSDGALAEYARVGALDVSEIYLDDTLLCLRDVLQLVKAHEVAIWRLETGDDSRFYSYGPWDEFLSLGTTTRGGDKWPSAAEYWWLQSYAVMGGSEGIYYHLDVAGNADEGYGMKSERLFLGKSLGATWEECYESAGRIAYILGA